VLPARYPLQSQLVLPLLDEVLRRGGSAPVAEVVGALADRFNLDPEQRARTSSSERGAIRTWDRHARWAYQKAKALGLLQSARPGVWEATSTGRARLQNARPGVVISVFQAARGEAFWATAETFVRCVDDDSAMLILTSPPYLLNRAKPYGGPTTEAEYVSWLVGLVRTWTNVLHESGTIVLNLGPCWEPGRPTMSLYRERIYLRLHDELGLHLVQDGYWHSPSKLPSPAEWVTVNRERLTPSVEHTYAFARSPRPKWSNRRVLRPYSKAMEQRLVKRERGGRRPSGHRIAEGALRYRQWRKHSAAPAFGLPHRISGRVPEPLQASRDPSAPRTVPPPPRRVLHPAVHGAR
jgi:hypothetical protein